MRRTCLAAAFAAAAVPLAAVQRQPDLTDVLRRAGAYAVGYGESMASVVADEDYRQQLIEPSTGAVLDARQLRSEVVIVRLTGSTDWLAFRDVQAVDGQDLAVDPGRLERLFRDAPAAALGQAHAIAEASARFNLGPLQRTFNAPTVTLQFLHPDHQERFTFRHRASQSGPPVCWVVDFHERQRHTLIRSPSGRDIPVSGTLWIEPDGGRLTRARYVLARFLDGSRSDRSSARIEVDWVANSHIGEWVPLEMRENYQGLPDPDGRPGASRTLTGVARYTNFRRFTADYRIR